MSWGPTLYFVSKARIFKNVYFVLSTSNADKNSSTFGNSHSYFSYLGHISPNTLHFTPRKLQYKWYPTKLFLYENLRSVKCLMKYGPGKAFPSAISVRKQKFCFFSVFFIHPQCNRMHFIKFFLNYEKFLLKNLFEPARFICILFWIFSFDRSHKKFFEARQTYSKNENIVLDVFFIWILIFYRERIHKYLNRKSNSNRIDFRNEIQSRPPGQMEKYKRQFVKLGKYLLVAKKKKYFRFWHFF